MVEGIVKRNKLRWTDSRSPNFLLEIRQWDYGVLVLNSEEGRGLDTRFRKAAHVAIIAKVKQQHEVQQMVGRSSRARGACEATLCSVGPERPAQVTERLRSYGIMALMDQERLLSLLERKSKDQTLIRCLIEASSRGNSLKSLEELRTRMGEQAFHRIAK